MKKLLLATAALGLVSGAAQAQVYNAGNDHFYQYVQFSGNWADALADAMTASTIAGYESYLATVTSQSELDFITGNVTTNVAYLSGTDQVTEGTWVWASGPEMGEIFFGPGAPIGAYNNWNGGEPNNLGNEDFLHMNFGRVGGWNDTTATGTSGYILEYSRIGVVPEPATWAFMIFGFGAIGGAMRSRRKTSIKVSFA